MLEPITAIGLAGNVIQLIDFGIKIVSTSRELYKTGSSALYFYQDIIMANNDLALLHSNLRSSIMSTDQDNEISSNDRALLNLAIECDDIAKQLREALEKVTVEGEKTKSLWKTLRHALTCVWRKEEIDELAARLNTYRDQMNTRILHHIK